MKLIVYSTGLIFLLATGCYASYSSAADIGFGMSARSDSQTIYIPARIDQRLTVEPFFQYTYNKNNVNGDTRSIRQLYGFGVMFDMGRSEHWSWYSGGRLAYYQNERKRASESTNYKLSEDGYEISPILGIRYTFTENFAISGEAEFLIRKTDGHHTDFDTDLTTKVKNEYASSTSRLIFRYYF